MNLQRLVPVKSRLMKYGKKLDAVNVLPPRCIIRSRWLQCQNFLVIIWTFICWWWVSRKLGSACITQFVLIGNINKHRSGLRSADWFSHISQACWSALICLVLKPLSAPCCRRLCHSLSCQNGRWWAAVDVLSLFSFQGFLFYSVFFLTRWQKERHDKMRGRRENIKHN